MRRAQTGKAITVTHVDLPSTDWRVLFSNLRDLDGSYFAGAPSDVFPTCCGKSFYSQVCAL